MVFLTSQQGTLFNMSDTLKIKTIYCPLGITATNGSFNYELGADYFLDYSGKMNRPQLLTMKVTSVQSDLNY